MYMHEYIPTYGTHYTSTYIHTYIRLVFTTPPCYAPCQARKAACRAAATIEGTLGWKETVADAHTGGEFFAGANFATAALGGIVGADLAGTAAASVPSAAERRANLLGMCVVCTIHTYVCFAWMYVCSVYRTYVCNKALALIWYRALIWYFLRLSPPRTHFEPWKAVGTRGRGSLTAR